MTKASTTEADSMTLAYGLSAYNSGNGLNYVSLGPVSSLQGPTQDTKKQYNIHP